MYLSKRDGAFYASFVKGGGTEGDGVFYASFVKGGGTEGDGGIIKKYEIQS